MKRATGVSLHSLYPDYMDSSLEFLHFNTRRNNDSYALNSCSKNRHGRVNFNFI